MKIVPFDEIHLLEPMDPSFESKWGTISGYVAEVVPGKYVSIFTGGAQATTQITRQNTLGDGMLTIPD